MFDPADPDRVTAFFDWDMTTLGDPLIDLGTLLNYWPDPGDRNGSRGSHPGMERMGLASRDELKRHYAKSSGIDLARVDWYEAFAQWKTATVVQQLHHRWAVGDSTDPRMEAIAAQVPSLAESAARLLEDA
jgi:aminoglycoside phosphotransferase (APT) family kinase protein